MTKPRARKILLKLLETTFSGLAQCEEVDIEDAYRLPDKKIKVRIKDYPFQINLYPDGKALHLYPEYALNRDGDAVVTDSYILFDPDTFYSQVSGFYRIGDGDAITLSGSDADQRAFLNISKETPVRKLSIRNEEGWLTFKSHVSNPQSCIAPLLKDKKVKRIVNWRRAKLRRLGEIFGVPIELLPSEEALALLQRFNEILEDEPCRPKDESGRPGGVVALPDASPVVIVGDLHAKPDNLLVVLSQNGFLEALEEGRISLVMLGDAVHPEGEAALDEMDSSMLMMDLIFKLKVRYPRQVFYLRGNHDSFSEEIAKHGIPQGLLWANALEKSRGKAYKKEMERCYELLPYVAFSRHFVACHAAAPVSSTTLQKLINIRDNPRLYRELTSNRLKQANRPSGYGKGDVKRFRRCLDVAEDTPFIVGHTPLSMDDTLWENVADIQNHYIVYSSDSRWVGLMAQIGDKLYPFKYEAEPLTAVINAFPRESAKRSTQI